MEQQAGKKTEESGTPPPDSAQPETFRPHRSLHNLPRGKNTWNPAILKKWWFWPACLAGLVALHQLRRLWDVLFSP